MVPQTFLHHCQKYCLQTTLDDNQIQLKLTIQNDESDDDLFSVYSRTLTFDTLPEQIKVVCQSLEDVFQCLKQLDGHQILNQIGQIKLKVVLFLGSHKKEKNMVLLMQRQTITHQETFKISHTFLKYAISRNTEETTQHRLKIQKNELASLRINIWIVILFLGFFGIIFGYRHESFDSKKQISSNSQALKELSENFSSFNKNNDVIIVEFVKKNYELLDYILKNEKQIKKIKNIIDPLQNSHQKLEEKIEGFQLMAFTEKQNKVITHRQFNFPFVPSPYLGKFNFIENVFVYIGQEKVTQLMLNQQIPINQEVSYTFKIRHSKTDDILIGVAGKQMMYERFSRTSGRAIGYLGLKNKIDLNHSGFTNGDIITVKIFRKIAQITWFINGIQKQKKNFEPLKQKLGVFVPFVQMFNTGDIVEWIPQDK